jgi:hypothetical protein
MSRSILKAARMPANANAINTPIASLYKLPNTRRKNALANIQANFNRRYPNNGNKNRRVTFKRKANAKANANAASNNVHAEHFPIPRRNAASNVAYRPIFYQLTADRERILGMIHKYYEDKISAVLERYPNANLPQELQTLVQVLREKQATVENTVAQEYDDVIDKGTTRNLSQHERRELDRRLHNLQQIGEIILDCEDSLRVQKHSLDEQTKRIHEKSIKDFEMCVKKKAKGNTGCDARVAQKYARLYEGAKEIHRRSIHGLLKMYDEKIDAIVEPMMRA